MFRQMQDIPVDGSNENPDLLGRNRFANRVSKLLILEKHQACLTVSIEGKWGCGKSSLINLVCKDLELSAAKPVLLHFNPWLVGNSQTLAQEFLVQLSASVGVVDKSESGTQLAKELLAYSQLFSVMKLIPGVEPWATVIQKVFSKLGKATQKIAELKKLDIQGQKIRVKNALRSFERPIVVIMDDIDRLIPAEAFQLLRLIKAIADFDGMSFLLAFDPSYLENILATHGIANSSEYLEKVVQVRLSMPVTSYANLQQMADQELTSLSQRDLTSDFEGDADRLTKLYHYHIKNIVRTPRELKRVFNHLAFVLSEIEGEVCFSDLFALSVFAIKAPQIYESIKVSPEFYVGRRFGETFSIKDAHEVVSESSSVREELFQSLRGDEKAYLRQLLSELFPLTRGESLSRSIDEIDRYGRVASFKRLYTAMHYQVPRGLISESDLKGFYRSEINREAFLDSLVEDKALERFFELSRAISLNTIPEKELADSLHVIYRFFTDSQVLENEQNQNYSSFGFRVYDQLRWLTNGFIQGFSNKKDFIFSLLEVDLPSPISAEIARELMIRNNLNQDKRVNRSGEEIWIDTKDAEEYVSKWIKLVVRQIESGVLFSSIHCAEIFSVLMLTRHNEISRLLNTLLCNGELEKIAKLICYNGSDSVNGRYVEFKKERYVDFLDIDLLRVEASKRLSNSEDLATYFEATLRSILDGKKYYLRDASQGEAF